MTKENYVATLIKANGSETLSRHFLTLSQQKELKISKTLCRDRRQLCRNTALKGKKTLWRQRSFMSRQTQHKVKLNSVMTKKSIVATKAEKS